MAALQLTGKYDINHDLGNQYEVKAGILNICSTKILFVGTGANDTSKKKEKQVWSRARTFLFQCQRD